MNRGDVRASVCDFIQETFLYMRPDFELRDDQSLMEHGIVDSMGVMEMLSFLEDTFGLHVDDSDVTEANLGNVNAIVEYVLIHSTGALRSG